MAGEDGRFMSAQIDLQHQRAIVKSAVTTFGFRYSATVEMDTIKAMLMYR